MAELVRESLQYPILRDESIGLLNTFHASGPAEYARSVKTFVRSHMSLYNEAEELLIAPWQILQEFRERGTSWGDCDDASMVAAALLVIQGIPARFKAIGQKATGDFSHVFVEYLMDGRWVPMDATSPVIPVYREGDYIIEPI